MVEIKFQNFLLRKIPNDFGQPRGQIQEEDVQVQVEKQGATVKAEGERRHTGGHCRVQLVLQRDDAG